MELADLLAATANRTGFQVVLACGDEIGREGSRGIVGEGGERACGARGAVRGQRLVLLGEDSAPTVSLGKILSHCPHLLFPGIPGLDPPRSSSSRRGPLQLDSPAPQHLPRKVISDLLIRERDIMLLIVGLRDAGLNRTEEVLCGILREDIGRVVFADADATLGEG